MNNGDKKKYVFFGIFAFVALIFWIRIVILAADPGNYQRAVSNALKKITIYPSRGIIYDRKGQLLVYKSMVLLVLLVKFYILMALLLTGIQYQKQILLL